MTIYEMLDAVKSLPRIGDYAEAGVWKGCMAEKIAARMNFSSWLWLFDTFEGHEEPGEHDLPQYHPKGRYADTSADEVEKRIRAIKPELFVVKGRIQDTLAQSRPNLFCFVNIDLDLYEPTKFAALGFKSRMVPGGIIRFDDYNHPETPGATKAIDEVFGRENILSGDYHWIA